jgi:methylated-DNA-[protein]-cysteine S-methyltransferase
MSPQHAETLFLDRLPSPIGTMLVVFDDQHRLRALDWVDYEERMFLLLRRQYRPDHPSLRDARAPAAITDGLNAYFDGALDAVDTIAVHTGGTPFQRAVWQALRQIPAGTTTTYSALAADLARPAARRAVGAANGANPICIVVPCHRVIGATGLTGTGGGLHRKQGLLAHEGAALSYQSFTVSRKR